MTDYHFVTYYCSLVSGKTKFSKYFYLLVSTEVLAFKILYACVHYMHLCLNLYVSVSVYFIPISTFYHFVCIDAIRPISNPYALLFQVDTFPWCFYPPSCPYFP